MGLLCQAEPGIDSIHNDWHCPPLKQNERKGGSWNTSDLNIPQTRMMHLRRLLTATKWGETVVVLDVSCKQSRAADVVHLKHEADIGVVYTTCRHITGEHHHLLIHPHWYV